MSESSPCVFCQIIDGSEESSQLYRDEHCMAFLDRAPINPGHALICPIRHVTSFVDLKREEMTAMLLAAQKIARQQLQNLPTCQGVNLLLAEGDVAGQEVPHTHLHVVPRAADDGFGWRRFGRETTREELDLVALELRSD